MDSVKGLCALWKAAPGRVDKTRQASFQVDDDLNPSDIKSRIDRILQQNNHHLQGSYIPSNSHRIIYHFLSNDSIIALTNTPIIIDHRSYYPRRPRYVQPSYGLEIAVAGVGEFSGVRSAIDNYIERTFTTPGSNEPVVRRSCLALDDTVYCVVLSTPDITQRLLAGREHFQPFGDSPMKHDKPQYVYTLNTTSIPLFYNPRAFSSFSNPQSDTILHRRLDLVNAQSEATAASLKEVVSDVKQLAHGFQEAQTTITKAFTDSTAIYSANSQLTAAQFDVSSLLQSISTNNILLGITPPERQDILKSELENLKEQLEAAKATRAARAAEVEALRISQTSVPLLQKPMPFLSVQASDDNSSSGHKRPRLELEEENQVQEMVTSMEVDHQVRSILATLSDFFETFSTLLDVSAARVDLLLKGLHDRASSTFPNKSSNSASSLSSPHKKSLTSLPSLLPFLSMKSPPTSFLYMKSPSMSFLPTKLPSTSFLLTKSCSMSFPSTKSPLTPFPFSFPFSSLPILLSFCFVSLCFLLVSVHFRLRIPCL